jgi:hypothetical protein
MSLFYSSILITIQVNITLLHFDDRQISSVQALYDNGGTEHEVFQDDVKSQKQAHACLAAQGLEVAFLDDLGNRWSKRWSSVDGCGKTAQARVLLQW